MDQGPDQRVTPDTPALAPVAVKERFETLDVLRGVALLGILVVNILAFAWPWAVMMDPPEIIAYTGINRIFLSITAIGFTGKMMSLFSMLFGAGVIMYDRKGSTGRLTENAGLWYRRMAWLLLIGAFHALVIWYGDILVWYAVVGLVLLWWVRRLPVPALLGLALVFALIFVVMSFLMSQLMMMDPVAQQALEAGENPMLAQMQPEKEFDAYQGSWLDGFLGHRLVTVLFMWFLIVPFLYFWFINAIMLLGMALTKAGVFTGERSLRFYLISGVLLCGVTVPLSWWMWFDFEASGFAWDHPQQKLGALIAPFQSLGYACLIIAALKLGLLNLVRTPLEAVGRMALTTYLLTSAIATTIFYGWGFGYFGKMEFPEMTYVMLGIWAFMLVSAPLWLRYFRFGPVEWLWRSLTYMRPQPMRLPRD